VSAARSLDNETWSIGSDRVCAPRIPASVEFGRTLAKAVQLNNDKGTVYAWDVWLLFGPEMEWTDTAIAQPALLMHQLWKLEGTKFPKLDTAMFAREVHNRLQALSASTVTPR
jgi:hypothetical protein